MSHCEVSGLTRKLNSKKTGSYSRYIYPIKQTKQTKLGFDST